MSPPTTNIQPLPEYKTSAAKKPKWVLSHYGMFKTCWDVLVLFATIYVAIMVPYNASFPDSNSLMLAELDSSQIFGIVRTFKKAKINGFLIFFSNGAALNWPEEGRKYFKKH